VLDKKIDPPPIFNENLRMNKKTGEKQATDMLKIHPPPILGSTIDNNI
jgi:hypothetical protein